MLQMPRCPDGPSLMCAAPCSTAKDAYRGQSMVRPDDAFDETPVYAMALVMGSDSYDL